MSTRAESSWVAHKGACPQCSHVNTLISATFPKTCHQGALLLLAFLNARVNECRREARPL